MLRKDRAIRKSPWSLRIEPTKTSLVKGSRISKHAKKLTRKKFKPTIIITKILKKLKCKIEVKITRIQQKQSLT